MSGFQNASIVTSAALGQALQVFKALRIISAALVGVCALVVAATIKANAQSLLGLPLKFTAGDCSLCHLLSLHLDCCASSSVGSEVFASNLILGILVLASQGVHHEKLRPMLLVMLIYIVTHILCKLL